MKYQDILNEYFLIKKEVNPAYSLRAFARDLGLPSSNLSNVLKGKQGLSIKSALQILERLKIKGRDRELFFDLVLSQDARATRDKAKAQERVEARLSNDSNKTLQEDFFKLVSDWYYFAILELATLSNFESDVDWIANQLGLKANIVDQALERLCKLNLLKNEEGRYRSTGVQLETSYDIPSISIKKHNVQILRKATEAIWNQNIEERETSTLTIAISEDDLPFVKEKIRKFKNELNDELMRRARTKKSNKVYCLCIQFFSLLKRGEN